MKGEEEWTDRVDFREPEGGGREESNGDLNDIKTLRTRF